MTKQKETKERHAFGCGVFPNSRITYVAPVKLQESNRFFRRWLTENVSSRSSRLSWVRKSKKGGILARVLGVKLLRMRFGNLVKITCLQR
jgi:hypothetical protein